MKESCHVWKSVLQIWKSYVTYKNESCHIYERVMSHIWKSHVTYMKEPCHVYERVMSRILRFFDCLLLGHVIHMNALCHVWERHVTCERGMSRVREACHTRTALCYMWMRHVTQHEWVSRLPYDGMSYVKSVSYHIWAYYTWMIHCLIFSIIYVLYIIENICPIYSQ